MPAEPWGNVPVHDDLFEAIREDESAFQEIFRQYFNVICIWCQYQYHFDMDLSKEAVHTSFIKLWENRKKISTRQPVKNYLFTIVNNTCIDIIRHQNVKRRYERHIQETSGEVEFIRDLDMSGIHNLQKEINNAVNSLPEKMRTIFQLSRDEGLKYTQIARQLGISSKTVETQISRAILKLRAKLREFYPVIFFYLFFTSEFFYPL